MASHHSASTRREFLGKQAGPTFLAALGLRAGDETTRRGQRELVALARAAMACRFEIILPAEDERALDAVREALDLVDRLERQMTVFRADSEVSGINRRAAGGAVRVEQSLFGLLQLSARLTTETAGAFDITTRPVGRVWMVCRQEQRLPRAGEVEDALEHVGMHHVRLDDARQTVEFGRPHVQLNLGAIGKGYALDRMAEVLRTREVANALIHSGHSSILALGSPPWEQDWIVSIRNPARAGTSIATVRLRDRCMSTSACGQQFIEVEGKRYGHIIDPRTGWPAQGALSATAFARTAAEADALSTAFFILGSEGTEAYCEKHPDAGALLVCEGEPGGEPNVLKIGIREDIVEVTA